MDTPYTPEIKEQSKLWIIEGERAPNKAKTLKSVGKVMSTVFWDARGIIYTDYLEKRQTKTGTYYASLLYRLSAEMKKERPHLKKIFDGQNYGIKIRITTTSTVFTGFGPQ